MAEVARSYNSGIETDYSYRVRLLARLSEMSSLDIYAMHTAIGSALDIIGGKYGISRGGINMNKESTIKRPDEALAALGELFRSRNAVYGSTYKDFGRIMGAFFPDGLTLDDDDGWNRLALFFHCADKLGRYARQFDQGGHADSLDDVSVYAQLLQECDAEARASTAGTATNSSGGGGGSGAGLYEGAGGGGGLEPRRYYVGGGSIYATDGQLYWVRMGKGFPAFIAEYRDKNRDRHGHEVGAAWWHCMDSIREVVMTEDFEVISWIERPKGDRK